MSGLGLARQVSARGLARPAAGPPSAADVFDTSLGDAELADLANGFVTNWHFTWLTWQSASIRHGSRSAAAWPARGTGCSRTWSGR